MGGLVIGPDKTLYATASSGGTGSGIVFSLTPPTAPGTEWIQTILYDFAAGAGPRPTALSLGADGVLYGTTFLLKSTTKQGGTVFSLSPPASPGAAWTEATVWQFPDISRFSGTSDSPNGPLLIQPQSGTLFGATGNAFTDGVVFEVSPPSAGGSGWSERVISPKNALVLPVIGLVEGGTVYGTDSGANIIWSLTP